MVVLHLFLVVVHLLAALLHLFEVVLCLFAVVLHLIAVNLFCISLWLFFKTVASLCGGCASLVTVLPHIVFVLHFFAALSVTYLGGLFSNPSMDVKQKEVSVRVKKKTLGIFDLVLSLLCG